MGRHAGASVAAAPHWASIATAQARQGRQLGDEAGCWELINEAGIFSREHQRARVLADPSSPSVALLRSMAPVLHLALGCHCWLQASLQVPGLLALQEAVRSAWLSTQQPQASPPSVDLDVFQSNSRIKSQDRSRRSMSPPAPPKFCPAETPV